MLKRQKERACNSHNQGTRNTRHYVINIENIILTHSSIEAKFEQWYNKSIVSSKKDKARSVEDNIKLKKSQADFAKTLAKLEVITENQKLGWLKTDQPKLL
jgi:hypothetical protein